jgi:hypothetical protein
MKTDIAAERQQRRRSSRTGGLGMKDQGNMPLLFRSIAEERYNIYDWQVTVKPLLTAELLDALDDNDSPVSPSSPFSSFTNPFAREPKSATGSKQDIPHKPLKQSISAHPYGQKEGPAAMISPSPSLRSKKSDLSSQSSSIQPPMSFNSSHVQSFGVLPSDLPSPASTSGYDNQFIEGWTSAQGRSSALSSHTRGSNSIASAVAPLFGSTPPGPRETILDRAFQMRCIPGSERIPEDDEQLSSIARFEALMREVDERKQQKPSTSVKSKQNWGLEESEGSSGGEVDAEDPLGIEMSDQEDEEIEIPPPAQRALDFIAGRRTPLPTSRPLSPEATSPPIPFLSTRTMSSFDGYGNFPSKGGNGNALNGLRPRTGTTSIHSGHSNRPKSLALPSRAMSTNTLSSLVDNPSLTQAEKRRSSSSVKRLSFTEFSKRASSTSSMLLVQANTSSGPDSDESGNSDGNSEEEDAVETSRGDLDKKRGWRGSVGVFGGGGGFL